MFSAIDDLVVEVEYVNDDAPLAPNFEIVQQQCVEAIEMVRFAIFFVHIFFYYFDCSSTPNPSF
jgi:hypothetical protein